MADHVVTGPSPRDDHDARAPVERQAAPAARDRRAVALGMIALLAGWPSRRAFANAETPEPAATGDAVELRISTKGDLLEFSTQQLACPAHTLVRVLFSNTSNYVRFDHNWVLLRPGSFDAVVAAAEKAGLEHDWVPAGEAGIIAATRLVHRGETGSVVFTSPAAGRYPYICTVPGHAASMWGVLTVTTP